MEATVSEIHSYPLRPDGFVEPLFETPESQREIANHLLRAPWLSRASEMPEKSGSAAHSAAHSAEEPVQLRRCGGGYASGYASWCARGQVKTRGKVEIVRPRARRCGWQRRRVIQVLMRWREIRSWWLEEERVDRFLFRVVVDGGGIVDLALERSGPRSGEWTITGIVD